LFFNKSETDIWLRDRFEELEKNDSRFKVKHILSEPNKSWTGEVGRITKDLVEQVAQSSTFTFICGPRTFNDIASQLAKDYHLEMHCFQG
jgi:cytochrome-b5 reductase